MRTKRITKVVMNISKYNPKVKGCFLQIHVPEEVFKTWDREAKRELIAEHTKLYAQALMKQLAKIRQLTGNASQEAPQSKGEYQIEFRQEWL